MDEEIDLRRLLRPLVRHYRLIVGTVVVAVLVAAVLAFLLPPTYRATAVVVVTRPQFQPQFDPRFQTLPPEQTRPYKAFGALVKSSELARRVLEQSRGRLNGETPTIEQLLDRVEVSQRDDPSVIQIAVKDRDPERAAVLANLWADLYVAYANEIYRPQSEIARTLETQLAQANQELRAAEDALIAFQRENDLPILNQTLQAKLEALRALTSAQETARTSVVGAQVAAQVRELQDLLQARARLRLALQDARSLADQIRQQGHSPGVRSGLAVLLVELEALNPPGRSSPPLLPTAGETRPGGSGPVIVQNESGGLPIQVQVPFDRESLDRFSPAELVAALEALQRTLGEKDQRLAQQIEEKTREIARLSAVSGVPPQETSPPPAIAGEVERLTQEVYRLQQALAEKTRTQDRLTLARDVARNAYTALANKLAEVKAASQVAEGDVRLAARAVVPEQPVWPRKGLFLGLGALVGLMVGLAGAWGWEALPGLLKEPETLPERVLVSGDGGRERPL